MSKTFERVSAFPLSWPETFPRTKGRQHSRFDTTLHRALMNVEEELQRFAKDSGKRLTDIIISSNYSLSDQKPDDPGVAVYFTWDEERTCIPVDRYYKIEDNLQAIYHCINAKRTMLRHGGINLVKAAFRGYAQLPPPGGENWRDVLGYQGSDLDEANKKYKSLMMKAHPDRPGGTNEAAYRLNRAWSEAEKELG